MSVPPRRLLPDRPSLAQLRKQAKELLGALRAVDASATLAAAQHVLAREYGCESWPKLVHHVESMQPRTLRLSQARLAQGRAGCAGAAQSRPWRAGASCSTASRRSWRAEDGRRPADPHDQRRLLLSRLARRAARLAGDARASHGAPRVAWRDRRPADGVPYGQPRASTRVTAARS